MRAASEGTDGCGLGYRFGPELGFGNAIQSNYPNRKIAIIKHARSNTNLYSQWAPGSSATDASHFGAQFKTFVATVDGGLQALKAKGLAPKIRAMLWQQGEADADAGGQNYGSNLRAFIGRVREQWSTPDPNTCYPNDLIHFGTQGQLELGKRMAIKVHDKLALP